MQKPLEPADFLDFKDILSHHNEHLELADFDLVQIKSVSEIDLSELVYDLVVEGNRNYQVSNLGIVHNGGKRSGAATVALPVWHNDILDFLDMQTEHGDMRMKAYDVFPQVVIPDIFMERDDAMGPWTTFCPFEVKQKLGIDVNAIWGDEFKAAYLQIEQAAKDGKLKVTRTFNNAREITKKFIRTQFETGLPYIAFSDTLNRANPNKHDGKIQCVNLCLTGDSVIEISIDGGASSELINLDQFVEKFEFGLYQNVSVKSKNTDNGVVGFYPVTRAFLTAKVNELIRIEDDNTGKVVTCTPDHKIWTTNRGWVEAKNLVESDSLDVI